MVDNAIVIENQKPGTPQSVWDAPVSTTQIEGFATQISVEHGDTVNFKINLNVGQGATAPYHVEIYRLGYYGGAGATLVTTLSGLAGGAQPNPITDSRGVVDAGNWAVSASWATPSTAVSGVYLAKIVRDDNGASNQIPFIVRADESHSDLVLQTSDTTWEAYNGWSGNNGQVGGSLYGGFTQPPNLSPDASSLDYNRAFAVSYNRPYLDREGGGNYAGPQDYLFGADYAAIYWLEKNGYDVSYISGVDTDRLGLAELTNHKAYISVGHDEYWSGGQRANVEAARDAGVNLLFWSGNEVYWKTRWENSIADGTAYRTLVSYKESKFNADPSDGPAQYANVDPNNQWTGLWRDTRFANAVASDGVTHTAVGARPENSLSGQMLLGDGTGQFGGAINVPAAMAGLQIWQNTGVGPNGATNIAPGIIGYEWDTSPNDAFRPAGLVKLSDTTLSWGDLIANYGNSEAPGTGEHTLTLYRAPSGALVFGAGTVFWSWGLSDEHDSSPYAANIATPVLQQLNLNILAQMGIQPGVADAILASEGLVRTSASADHIAASAAMSSLPANLTAQTPITLSGTATDADNDPSNPDGKVAIVEVSVDGGQTWTLAQGTTNWTFNWTPAAAGTYTVESRAIDDTLNLPSGAQIASQVVSVSGPTSFSLFSGTTTPPGGEGNDGRAVELGMKFTASQAGSVTALRYFRGDADASDTDTRAGHLWASDGTLLGSVTFTSGPGQSGWQQAALSTPVALQPGVTYIVSYNTADNYFASTNYFTNSVSDPFGMLTAPSTSSSGGNGVYLYGSGAVFPTQTYQASNYWADVVFTPGTTSTSQIGFSTTTLTQAEGDSGTTAFNYTVTRTGDTSGAASASWAVTGSGASPANAADFTGGVLPSGTVSFAAGETSKTIAVGVAGDTTAEPNEGFTVTLSNASGATLATATATGTITNDDGLPSTISLFSAATPSGTEFNDNATVELGMKFSAAQAGSITALRYFRDASDASDTDTRAGHLWASDGTLLGTVTFTSGPNQSGWQTASLSTPVALQPGVTYVVSYTTANNYLATANYFTSSVSDPNGVLTAPASAASGGNGVYAYGSALSFPNQSYQASNYWTDVVFAPAGSGPTTPSNLKLDSTTDSGALGDGVTNKPSVLIDGSADAGASVTVFDGATAVGTATASGAGAFQVTTSSLGDGVHSLTAQATVSGATSAASTPLSVTIDTQAPAAPTSLADSAIVGGTVSDTNNTASQTLTGTAEKGASVAVFDGATKLGTTAADASTGQWSFTLGRLASGSHSLTATASDLAANTGPASTALTFTVASGASAGVTLALATDTGSSATDRITSNAALVGTADANATLTLTEGSTTLGTTTANASGAWTFTPSGLAEGAHTLTATETIGGTGSAQLQFTLDTVPPAPVIQAATPGTTTSLSGTSEPASVVTILDGATARGTVTADAAGAWSLSVSGLSSTVTHMLTARATDLAGNVGTGAGAVYLGSSAADTLTGGAGPDLMFGQAASDQLTGGAGNDTLDGGTGNDSLDGGAGDDVLVIRGTQGQLDSLTGGDGTDTVRVDPASGAVTLAGTGQLSGVEVFDGGGQAVRGTSSANVLDFSGFTSVTGVASISGLGGTDTITGTAGADTIDGGGAADRLNGGGGDDVFLIRSSEAQSDTIDGGLGTDTVRVDPAGGTVTLSSTSNLTGIENFDGGGQAVQGTSGANVLDFSGFASVTGVASIAGLGGADTLTGSGGSDLLDGGGGADVLNGGAGADTLIGGTGADSLTGGAGSDIFRFNTYSDSPSSGRDVILDFEGAGVAGGDLIDVSPISGSFVFNGTGAFTGGGIASIRYVQGAGFTDVQFDNGTGGSPEMVVRINAVVTLTSGDFIL